MRNDKEDEMNSYDFCVAAKNAIIKVAKELYGDEYTIEDIQVVWMVHLLGYKKGIYIDNGKNQRIYEVTYNREKNEMYVDTYDKVCNTVVSGDNIDTVAHV
jgi:tRNA U34 2-thiouridine synthase MnmA/TrmU